MKDITKQLSQVWEFHQAFRVEQSVEARIGTQDKRILRLNLFAEELGEFTKATYDNDSLEQLDGVIDMIYILCGSVNYHGLSKVFSNFLQGEHDTPNQTITSYPVNFGLILKDNNNEKKYLYGSITLSELLQMYIQLMATAINLYNKLENTGVVVKNSFELAFTEVHESNMSKLENGKPVMRKDGKVLKGKDYFKPNLAQFIK